MPNQFENNEHGGAPDDAPEYEELTNVIDISGIQYTNESYVNDEIDILQPRLIANGFYNIRWGMGDRDAFGPLTRICYCRDSTGKQRQFIYG